MKRQNLRTVSLIIVTFTYLLAGAAIFGYLESDHETRQREALELIELIVKRKYNISEDDFTVLTTTVIKSVPHKAGIQWRFPGAFYFATTVVTTIGYGHSTPATLAGRSFCMIYALIGIPLGLVMFQSIGERLNTFVGAALQCAKRCLKAKNPEVTQTNLVMVVLVLSTILMTSMAAVFAKYERWDYFDALYYCFITLTTIGFGDYVALQKESALQSKPEYVALSLIFILFGLSVVSSAVNLLVLKFLTLNTEDERRDERLRFKASRNPIQLQGDVIMLPATSGGGAAHLEPAKQQQQHQQQLQLEAAAPLDDDANQHLARAQRGRRPHLHRCSAGCDGASQASLSPVQVAPSLRPWNNRYTNYDKEEEEPDCSCSLDSSPTTTTATTAPGPARPPAANQCVQCLLLHTGSHGAPPRLHRPPGRHRTPIAKHSAAHQHSPGPAAAAAAGAQYHKRRLHHASTRSTTTTRRAPRATQTSFGLAANFRKSHNTLHYSTPSAGNPLQLAVYPMAMEPEYYEAESSLLADSSARLARSQPQVTQLACRCCCREPECGQQALHLEPPDHERPEEELYEPALELELDGPAFSFIDKTPMHQPTAAGSSPATTTDQRSQIFSVDSNSTSLLKPASGGGGGA